MKNLLSLIAILSAFYASAQNELFNNGSIVFVASGCTVQVNGSFTNSASSTFTNNGSVTITGNSTNNQTMATANGGVWIFKGTAAQTLNGTATFFAKDVTVNNAAGVTLNTTLKVDGVCTFTSGNIIAPAGSTPLLFSTNGSHTGASDASHVNGYVVKEGTGNFDYPVGDASKYQKTTVNLTANGSGLQVKYNASTAGSGIFTSTGSEATPLLGYNQLEYWDIVPLTTSTGTVTIYWDTYNNVGITNVSHLKVAHKVSGNWLNEGTTGTGTLTNGSVTGNSISTWSPFTLGTISNLSRLPVKWIAINASLNNQKQTVINWKVQEFNVANYSIEKSTDAINYTSIGTIKSKGDGENEYSYTEANSLNGKAYYRINQAGTDGYTLSSKIMVLNVSQVSTVTVYPNPTADAVNISSNGLINTYAIISDIHGRVLQISRINGNYTTIDMTGYAKGTYMLKLENGKTIKLIKQ